MEKIKKNTCAKDEFYSSITDFDISFFTDDITDRYKNKKNFISRIQSSYRIEKAKNSLAFDISIYSSLNIKGRYQKIEGTTKYSILKKDIFFYTLIGETEKVKMLFNINPKKIMKEKDEMKRTLLYIAAKSGYMNLVKFFLNNGANVNEVQFTKSTVLHVACYYNHKHVVELLLEYGSDLEKKNEFGNKPIEESSEEVAKILKSIESDKINDLYSKLSRMNDGIYNCLVQEIENIKLNGEIIGKRLKRNRDFIEKIHQIKMKDINDWESAWHGTKHSSIPSIFKNGLVSCGSELNGKLIQPLYGHIKRNITINNIKNWSDAIFASPSILYASHYVYAERILCNKKIRWVVLIEAKIKPGSFTEHNHTLISEDLKYFKNDNIGKVEFRVNNEFNFKSIDNFFRVPIAKNVVVVSMLYARVSFLENAKGKKDVQIFNF